MLKQIFIITILFSFLITGTFASGWHPANDIFPGTFSSGNFKVDGNFNVTTGNDVCIDGGICLSTAGAGTLDGSGTTNYIPKFTDSTTVGNSAMYDNSGRIGIGTITSQTELEITGRWYVTAHGTTPTTGAGMFGSYNPALPAGLIQAYDYNIGTPLNISIQAAGGNVGIGTSTPTTTLEIVGTSKTDDIIIDNQLSCSKLYTDATGNVLCGVDSNSGGDITAITAGTGLTGGGSSGSVTLNVGAGSGINVAADTVAIDDTYTQRRVSGTCAAGNSIRVINADGTVTCEADTDTDTNTNAATICSNGQFLNGDGTCDAGYLDADGVDANTDTQDLGVSGTTITLVNGGSVTAPYATYTANSNACNNDGTCQVNAISDADVGTIRDNNGGWIRTYGTTGWYSQTYAGGWYMVDTTYVRSYSNKHVYTTGAYYGGAFYYASDKKFKKNIIGIKSALEKVKQLKGVEFTWKKDNRSDIGFIAQDVEKILPQLVSTDNATGDKSVKYGNIVAIVVEAIKEQQETLEKQEQTIKNQQIQIYDLKKDILELKNQ